MAKIEDMVARVVAQKIGAVRRRSWGSLSEESKAAPKFSSLADWMASPTGMDAVGRGEIDLSSVDVSQWGDDAVPEVVGALCVGAIVAEDGVVAVHDPDDVMGDVGVSIGSLPAMVKTEMASSLADIADSFPEMAPALQKASAMVMASRVEANLVSDGIEVVFEPPMEDTLRRAGVDEQDVPVVVAALSPVAYQEEGLNEASKFYPFKYRKRLDRSNPLFGPENKRNEVSKSKCKRLAKYKQICVDKRSGRKFKVDMTGYYRSGKKQRYSDAHVKKFGPWGKDESVEGAGVIGEAGEERRWNGFKLPGKYAKYKTPERAMAALAHEVSITGNEMADLAELASNKKVQDQLMDGVVLIHDGCTKIEGVLNGDKDPFSLGKNESVCDNALLGEAVKIVGTGPEKRFWELYTILARVAQYCPDLRKPVERKTVAMQFLGPDESKELLTLYRKVFSGKGDDADLA